MLSALAGASEKEGVPRAKPDSLKGLGGWELQLPLPLCHRPPMLRAPQEPLTPWRRLLCPLCCPTLADCVAPCQLPEVNEHPKLQGFK